MRLRPLMLVLVWLVALAQPNGAAASRPVYFPRHDHHCRQGYHRVVRHRHGHRRIACVKRRHPSIKLHAHLDPSYVRNPLDPFEVTYAYSASASQETARSGQISSEAPLPEGVLAFYSDGSLECAINVAGAIDSSTCPVHYDRLGEHRVTTIYSSGSLSATATEIENIEPLDTTTSLSLSFQPTPEDGLSYGMLTINVSSSPPAAPGSLRVEARISGGPSGGIYWSNSSGASQIKLDVQLAQCPGQKDWEKAKCASFPSSLPEPLSYFNEEGSIVAMRDSSGGYRASSSSAPLELGLTLRE